MSAVDTKKTGKKSDRYVYIYDSALSIVRLELYFEVVLQCSWF